MIITDRKEVNKMLFKIKKYFDNNNAGLKIMRVGSAKWGNAITKEMQTVNDIYVLGFETCERPIMIKKFDIEDEYGTTNTYKFDMHLCHTNISSSDGNSRSRMILLNGKPMKVWFFGQEFCNPLTAEHVYNGDEKDIKGLIKANLLSQNFDDAYTSVESVMNGERDMSIYSLTKDNSALELLMGRSAAQINSLSEADLIEQINRIKKIKDEQIWAKYKNEHNYSLVAKHDYRLNRSVFSDYYPTFDKKYIDNLNIELPKEEYDLGVYGLGSAGTAIIDQVCRSNWIKNIYLCDFDTVEEKNLINQWYERDDIGEPKARATAEEIKRLERRDDNRIKQIFTVKYDNKRFQDTDYKNKKFKYVISGFDSIKVRQEFFEKVESGELEADYLIDCRYLDLSSSVYIIDTKNKEQMNFYKLNLEADAELLNNEAEPGELTEEQFYEWLEKQGTFECNCGIVKSKYFKEHGETISEYCSGSCGGTSCKQGFYAAYKKTLPNPYIKLTENTCVKQNYIDIYKYVGAIVFGTMRNIENNQDKPFTLVEAQTDVTGLPNYMVVKE